jgi:hypothetical protein
MDDDIFDLDEKDGVLAGGGSFGISFSAYCTWLLLLLTASSEREREKLVSGVYNRHFIFLFRFHLGELLRMSKGDLRKTKTKSSLLIVFNQRLLSMLALLFCRLL